MAPAKTNDVVVALESGYFGVGDAQVIVHKGDLFRSNDPVVKKYPAHFGPVTERIEQATAAPGEKR